MGKIDTASKDYFGKPERFAAVFNYLLYDGKQVINPNHLQPIDPTETIVVRKDDKSLPLQRVRDKLMNWTVFADDVAVYVLLAEEYQAKSHPAMPVKNMLYDGIDYASQANEISRKNKQEHNKQKKQQKKIEVTEKNVVVNVSDPDFLTGLKPEDKLKPVITATLYTGEEPWSGPICLHDILNFPNDHLKRFVPNYDLNLLDPHAMEDDDFIKLGELDVGFVMKVMKHQKKGAASVLYEPKYEQVEPEAADAANDIAKLGLTIVIEGGKANMCRSMREHDQMTKVVSAISIAQEFINDEKQLVDFVSTKCAVAPAIVSQILGRMKSGAPVTA